MEDEPTLVFGKPFFMTCNITADPEPEIKWYKDEDLITTDERFELFAGRKTLRIKNATLEDAGVFRCVGENRFGKVEKSIKVIFYGKIVRRATKIQIL